MPVEPFPIADFVEGLQLDKEPWLSPTNAFRRMENARVFRGRLEKRTGFSRFAEITEDIADLSEDSGGAVIGGSPRIDYYEHTDDTIRLIPESVSFFSDNGAGADITASVDLGSERWIEVPPSPSEPFATGLAQSHWYFDVVETGTSTVIGALTWSPSVPLMYAEVQWPTHSGFVDVGTNDGQMLYRTNPGDDIVGLARLNTADQAYTVAWTPDFAFEYDASAGYFVIQGEDDGAGGTYAAYLTGDEEDYVWHWPTDDVLLFTNGVDPLYKWQPTASQIEAVIEMDTAWDGGSNELDTCRLVFIFGGRMLVINTTESATQYPGRMRWTAVGAYETYNDPLDFSDAPAELGEAVSGQLIGDRLFIAFEFGWAEVVITNDPNEPFEWRRFISRFGAVSKNSIIQDNERLLSRSDTTMQSLDPNGQYYIDQEIPDLVRDFSAEKTHLCSAVRHEDQRAFWWTYVHASDTSPSNVLVATYDEDGGLSWSQYDMVMRVFSQFDSLQTPTWNGLGPLTWNDYSSTTWNDARVGIAGFTQIIGGSTNGQVYLFDTSAVDRAYDGQSDISMLCETQWLQPHPGERSHLAWLDIFGEAVTGSTMKLSFFKDHKPAAYLSREIDFSPDAGGAKVWRRIRVKGGGQFHRIRIESSDSRAVAIDAVVPYFRKIGRARGIN